MSTLAPALNVRSMTLPVTTFLSFVRTNAPPLPGLTCWNSTTLQSCPSILMTTPFLMSAVDAMSVEVPFRVGFRAAAPRRSCAGRQSILKDEPAGRGAPRSPGPPGGVSPLRCARHDRQQEVGGAAVSGDAFADHMDGGDVAHERVVTELLAGIHVG